MVSRLAVGDLHMKPAEERFAPLKDPPSQVAAVTAYRRSINRLDRVSSDLPFDSRGGLSFQYYFPVDGEYLIRIMLPTGAASYGEGITGDVNRTELRLPVKAGLRTIGVTFLKESAKPEVEGGGRGPRSTAGRPMELENDPVPSKMDLRMDGARLKLFDVPRRPGANPDVNTVIVSGPHNITGRGDTPSRAKIFVCRPSAERDEEPCARQILGGLARRAFRRPVTEADLKPLLGFYQKAAAPPISMAASRPRCRRCWCLRIFCSAPSRSRAALRPKPTASQPRSGLTAFLLPVEQHSRRRTARPGRPGQAQDPEVRRKQVGACWRIRDRGAGQ